MGWISFINVVVQGITTYFVILFRPNTDLQSLIQLNFFALTVFGVIFGAVFGTSSIKKYWEGKNSK